MTDKRQFFISHTELQETDRFVLFSGSEIIVREEQYLWTYPEAESFLQQAGQLLLVERSEPGLVALDLKPELPLPEAAEKVSLRSLLFNSEKALLSAGKANQVLDWYRAHRFCGFCGAPTTHGEDELVLECKFCRHHFFPRINPCVIMLVIKDKQILLARSSRYRSGYFSCLAGFIEVGESAEETVIREVKEETSLDVENVRYFKSQSWPFPSQLMLGFCADYKAGEIVPEPGEIEEAYWFDADNLPKTPSGRISVAGQLIDNFIEHMQ